MTFFEETAGGSLDDSTNQEPQLGLFDSVTIALDKVIGFFNKILDTLKGLLVKIFGAFKGKGSEE